MTEIIGLLAETFIHPGTGQTAGAIDLPVARERTTQYPFISGSSMKGALLDAARTKGLDQTRQEALFGRQDNGGALLVSDARLLLLPVRSLSGPYRWVTCPYLLERFDRDLRRAGRNLHLPDNKPSAPERALAHDQGDLFLEERLFAIEGTVPDEIVNAVGALIPHNRARSRLREQLVVVGDKDFAWFAQYALPVQARNVLDTERKTSRNLWYEETLPPDTLMYLVLGERGNGAAHEAAEFLSKQRYLQAGGNETVGHGWFAVKRYDGGAS